MRPMMVGGERGAISIGGFSRKIVSSAKKFAIPNKKISEFADSVRIFGGNVDEIGDVAATLTKKIDFVFGKATGSAHNIDRSLDMLRQLERIGLPDNPSSRKLIRECLERALKDETSIIRQLEGGRVLRESLLSGPRGHLKIESIWEANKLITIMLKGGI